MVLLQNLRARNGYTEHTEKTKAGVSSVSSVVKKFIEVFFVDENALIACYERGLNENTNGLIRQYFPKGTDFSLVPLSAIREAERRLNERPRKTLEFYTPSEKFYGLITNKKLALAI